MDVGSELESKREAIIARVLEVIGPVYPDQPMTERRQFAAGYLDTIQASAKGDNGPRDEYLATVIPGLKTTGTMGLGAILGHLIRIQMIIAAEIANENLSWHTDFAHEYTNLLVAEWERA